MQRSTDRILTTHTGSLARPASLRAMLRADAAGEVVEEGVLQEAVRTAVAQQVQKQAEIGLAIINDGEQSKISYTAYVQTRLTGFEEHLSEAWPPSGVMRDFPGWAASRDRGSRPVATGQLGWKHFDAVERDIENLKTAAAGQPIDELFMTAPSPATFVNHVGSRCYSSRNEYLAAVADVMRREYEAIVDAGILLQLDCPDRLGRDSFHPDLSIEEFRRVAAENVEALNAATCNISPERMRIHVCWGAIGGPHANDVELKNIVDIVLTARPMGMSVVAANGRHAHEWEVWKHVALPDGKVIIPGVIDSTSNIVEHPAVVKERITRYVEVLGREQVIAGVDCGFATTGTGIPVVDPQVAWAKLSALVEGARLASSGT
jgi:5-methyltetrahydropteroyltriglutamate--homocysteine methyltransferase